MAATKNQVIDEVKTNHTVTQKASKHVGMVAELSISVVSVLLFNLVVLLDWGVLGFLTVGTTHEKAVNQVKIKLVFSIV